MRENALLARIASLCAAAQPGVIVPVGDDCAMLELSGRRLLAAVDPVIEGVHFAKGTPGRLVGAKALKRNLSDVAAMAARPAACLLQLTLPPGCSEDEAFEVVRGVHETGLAFGCPLVGGDVSVGSAGCPLVASVTVLAEPWPGVEVVRRTGASPGDHVFVTGALGGSLEETPGGAHHLAFVPRVELARMLASSAQTRPTAMMDLSDGLAQDLPRLAAHAVIEIPRLPVSQAAKKAAQKSGRSAWKHAVGDGEDYELLFAASPLQSIPHELAGVPITRIGSVTCGGGVRLMVDESTLLPMDGLGWEHRS